MTAALLLDPSGFAYVGDTDTGMYRTGANAQAIKCNGSDVVAIATTGIDITGDLDVSGTINQNGIPLLPIGLGPIPWPTSSAPSGWLLCFGQSLLRTTYASLFGVIGTTYGAVDSTHFSLPDLRGRIAVANDAMGGTPAGRVTATTATPNGVTLGATGGAQVETITQANLPNITLNTAIAAGQGSHSHNISPTALSSGPQWAGGAVGGGQAGASATVAATLPAMVGTTPLGGGATDLTTMPPFVIFNYIMFAGV